MSCILCPPTACPIFHLIPNSRRRHYDSFCDMIVVRSRDQGANLIVLRRAPPIFWQERSLECIIAQAGAHARGIKAMPLDNKRIPILASAKIIEDVNESKHSR